MTDENLENQVRELIKNPKQEDNSVEDRIKNIITTHFGNSKDKIYGHTNYLNDLGADSLDCVELLMEIEDEFEIAIPDDEAEKIKTYQETVDYITWRLENLNSNNTYNNFQENNKDEMYETVYNKVVNIAREQFNSKNIQPNTNYIDDLGADSLDSVELVMELEDEFEISIPDDDCLKIKTIDDSTNYVIQRLKEK